MLWQLLTNIDVRILSSIPILPTSLSLVKVLIICRSSPLANLKPGNLTLLVNWRKMFPKSPSLRIRKTQAERILVAATVHQTLMDRMIIPLTQPAGFLEIKALKVFKRKSLTITTGLLGGPPPKESLTWKGGWGGDQKLTPGQKSNKQSLQALNRNYAQKNRSNWALFVPIHLTSAPYTWAFQGCEPSERMQKTSKFQDCLTVRTNTLNWQNDSSKGSCFPGSTPSQYTSTPEELRRLPESSPSSEGNSRCRGLVRPGMVSKQPTHSQHRACELPPPQHSDPVRYFGVRLGGCVQQLTPSPLSTWSTSIWRR